MRTGHSADRGATLGVYIFGSARGGCSGADFMAGYIAAPGFLAGFGLMLGINRPYRFAGVVAATAGGRHGALGKYVIVLCRLRPAHFGIHIGGPGAGAPGLDAS